MPKPIVQGVCNQMHLLSFVEPEWIMAAAGLFSRPKSSPIKQSSAESLPACLPLIPRNQKANSTTAKIQDPYKTQTTRHGPFRFCFCF